MEALIQITGVQYACEKNNVSAVMAELEQQKPEVVLVTEQTHDFGIIVRALTGNRRRGVVSRFDLERVLRIMMHDNMTAIVGRVAETDTEGRCYTIRLSGDFPDPDTPTGDATDIWDQWRWTGAPLLYSSDDERQLDISLKIALAELKRNGSMNKQTLKEHLDIVLKMALWDVSHETQKQLNEIRQLVSLHPDDDIRALTPHFRHTLTAIGSKKRTAQFQDTYFPALCQGKEAERMHRQWCAMHRAELSDIKQWQPTISRQLDDIEACLMSLPADLCYQKDLFGPLMHRLLYLNIPRQKLLMLLSALVLRQLLRRQLGLDDDASGSVDEAELQLVQQLAPIFYGNTDSAREFLLLARDQKAADITSLVSLWVRDRRICEAHCHRPLWTILHDAGIYKATESNWNMQLGVRKGWR